MWGNSVPVGGRQPTGPGEGRGATPRAALTPSRTRSSRWFSHSRPDVLPARAVRIADAAPGLPRPCRADGRTTSQTASGCLAATCRSTRAGPSGIRRPCSQLRSVFTLIPSRAANPSCDSRYVARRRFTFGPSTTKAREAAVSPRRMAPPWRTLAMSWSNNRSFTRTPPRRSSSAI